MVKWLFTIGYVIIRFITAFILAVAVLIIVPILFTLIGSFGNHGGMVEQLWLNESIRYLMYLRKDCTDSQLKDVLDYTIRHYHKIGPFDVAVMQCDWLPLKDEILGINNPLCPGITLDIDLLVDYTPHEGAEILVHEALHDYYPFFGHSQVTPVINKLRAWERAKIANDPPPPPSFPSPIPSLP